MSWFAKVVAVAGLSVFAAVVPSQRLLKDIRVVPNVGASSDPRPFFRLNDILLFRANDGVVGPELWRTDGTPAGTQLVKDIWAGPVGSAVGRFARFGDIALCGGKTRNEGFELWRTDGTAAGTYLVKDIWPGRTDSLVAEITEWNGKAYFFANDGTHGTEFWVTDGTTAGTRLLKDIRPGSESSAPRWLRIVGGRLLFAAHDGVHGRELWTSDGTTAGTVLLKDIYPGPVESNPGRIQLNGDVCYFLARTPAEGFELWTSDGTAAGTRLVKDIRPGSRGSDAVYFAPLQSGLMAFRADDGVFGSELWVTDGTAANTKMVTDLNPGLAPTNMGPTQVAGELIFYFAFTASTHFELARSDGTAQGTFLLGDIKPGVVGQTLWGGWPAGRLSDVCLFAADDGTSTGNELWGSDGSVSGTRLLRDIHPTGSSNPRYMTTLGDKVVFQARNGVNGIELWVADLKDLGAANAEPYGVGCPGTGGKVPAMQVRGIPEVASAQFGIQATDVVANSPLVVFMISATRGSLALGGGCRLLVGTPLVTLNSRANATGVADAPLPVPNDPSLVGQSLYFSSLAIDPQGSFGNVGAIANGLRVVFGR